MRYTLALTYGDPSRDGHGMSETDYYISNYSSSDVQKAMTKAEKAYNFNFDAVCSEYGERTLTEEQYGIFANNMKIDLDKLGEEDEDEFLIYDFPGLYLAVVKTQLQDLKVEAKVITKESINIGGYGLFEN